MNLIRDKPKFLAKTSTEKIVDITENLEKFFVGYKKIQEITGFSKKRLDLWLFRDKTEIEVLKYEKQKFVSLSILKFLPKMVKSSKREK